MEQRFCKWCGVQFVSKSGKGVDQEYCNPTHRNYENTYQWLRKKKESFSRKERQPLVLDEQARKRIEAAVDLTVACYGDTLRKLAKE